ncbi:TolC family protein [Pseudomonas syringae]|uniref:TolC family protein n=1 Tax=Pseudomonas syringae TaxID=317 RepID=UPI000409C59D|nr:TolC family protein [Pseudomonas syringae]
MTRLCQLFAALVLLLSGTLSSMAAALDPSRPSMPDRTVSLSAQVIELTLADAVYLGLRDNRSIRSAYLDRIAQKFDLRVAKDQFTPKLVLSSRYLATRNQSDHYRQAEVIPQTTLLSEYGTRLSLAWSNQLTMADSAGRNRNDGATFSVIQPLLRGAGREIATAPVRLAVLSEKINQLALKSAVSDTITQIITGYRELLRAQEQVRIARDALERSRQLLVANRAMIAAGLMAEFDIVQTEADVATQELAIEEAANDLDASRLQLLRLLALDLGTRLKATEALDASQVDVSRQRALATAQEQQPEYLTRLIAAKQAEINLVVARNERLWDVSLVGGASQVRDRYQDGSGPGTTRTWEGYAGIQVDIPIGDLSRRQAEVRARVDVENEDLRLVEAGQALEQGVGDAVRNLGTRWRQYEIAQRAGDLSRRKLDIEREKMQSGRSSNFQVLSYETDLRSAENARLNALIAYLNAQTGLDQTLGTTLESWAIDLND